MTNHTSTETSEPTDSTVAARISRRRILTGGAATAVGAVGLAGLLSGCSEKTETQPSSDSHVKAARVREPLPFDDPESDLWDEAEMSRIALNPQQMALPNLGAVTIETIDVRALYDGRTSAFLLEWDDEKADDLESVTRFRDAAAVMIPMELKGEPPIITMGAAGRPVYIIQWKASWQRDVDEGFQGVEASYPRWFNDVYPGHEVLVSQGMDSEAAQAFYPGLAVGNSLSKQSRRSPVEELIAEGFGSLTTLESQKAKGRGVHDGGRWKVSLGPSAVAPSLGSGTTVPVAFALWDGGRRQVGARKHYVGWSDLIIPSR